MPAASGFGGGTYIDPFTGKKKKVPVIKPTGPIAPSAAAVAARSAEIARQNESLPGGSTPFSAGNYTAPAPYRGGPAAEGSGRVMNPDFGGNFGSRLAQLGDIGSGSGGGGTTNPALLANGFSAAAAPGTTNATLAAQAAAGTGNPNFPTGSGYQAQTALGKSYRDLMLPSAWNDPEALIDTFYRTGGLAKGSGDYGTQLEGADNLGILYMALMGEDAYQGNANFVDWASNYLTDQRRADGVSISPGEIWNALVNPGDNTPLNYYLNNPTLTPEDQVNNFMSSMRYGMETTLPAPILNALMAQVDQMGREFRSLRNTQAGGASFTGYLNSRPNSLPVGF